MASQNPGVSDNSEQAGIREEYCFETTKMLKRIIKKMGVEKIRSMIAYFNKANVDPMLRAQHLTGLSCGVLDHLRFTECVIKETKHVDRYDIHQALMRFYATDNRHPTTKELFDSLCEALPPYVDIRMFRKILMQLDYVWKLMPNKTICVAERPQVTFQRYKFLKEVFTHRAEGKAIVYIGENYFYENGDYFDVNDAVVDRRCGSIDSKKYVVYGVTGTVIMCPMYFDDLNEKSLMKWIDELLYHMPPSSVLVLEENERHSREIVPTPNAESLNQEMRDWLDYHQVPYPANMTKVELLDLIEKSTDTTQKLYRIDTILNVSGHYVLRLPRCISNLTPAKAVFETVKNNLVNDFIHVNGAQEKVKTIFGAISEQRLSEFEELINTEQKELLYMDVKIDTLMDDFVIYSRGEQYINDEDSDFPLSDAE